MLIDHPRSPCQTPSRPLASRPVEISRLVWRRLRHRQVLATAAVSFCAVFFTGILGAPLAAMSKAQASDTAAATDTPVSEAGAADNGQAPEVGAFGFGLGEERRYAIGPPGALEPGEGELWIMRLVSITGEPPNQRINFRLEHEATRYQRTPNVFNRGELMVFRGRMELTVNEHGFPLRIQYRGDFDKDPTTQYGREEVTLSFAEGGFAVHNRLSMQFRRYDLKVPTSPLVDPTVPRGVYVSGSENPALYSLVLVGAGIEEVGDIEYMSLMPSRLATRDRRGFDRATRARGLSRTRLRFEELTTVDIGGVEEEALRLRRPGGARPDIYVRPDGTLLRVDISTDRKHSAFIRLLRPTEY